MSKTPVKSPLDHIREAGACDAHALECVLAFVHEFGRSKHLVRFLEEHLKCEHAEEECPSPSTPPTTSITSTESSTSPTHDDL